MNLNNISLIVSIIGTIISIFAFFYAWLTLIASQNIRINQNAWGVLGAYMKIVYYENTPEDIVDDFIEMNKNALNEEIYNYSRKSFQTYDINKFIRELKNIIYKNILPETPSTIIKYKVKNIFNHFSIRQYGHN